MFALNGGSLKRINFFWKAVLVNLLLQVRDPTAWTAAPTRWP